MQNAHKSHSLMAEDAGTVGNLRDPIQRVCRNRNALAGKQFSAEAAVRDGAAHAE